MVDLFDPDLQIFCFSSSGRSIRSSSETDFKGSRERLPDF